MDQRKYPVNHSNFCEPEDFKNVWGIDLFAVMRDDGITPDQFLARVERQIKQFIDQVGFRTWDWGSVENYWPWREAMQMAILEQAYYLYRNTDIATDAGYDPDKGMVADPNVMKKVTICNGAYQYLHDAGMLNRTLPKHLGRRWDW